MSIFADVLRVKQQGWSENRFREDMKGRWETHDSSSFHNHDALVYQHWSELYSQDQVPLHLVRFLPICTAASAFDVQIETASARVTGCCPGGEGSINRKHSPLHGATPSTRSHRLPHWQLSALARKALNYCSFGKRMKNESVTDHDIYDFQSTLAGFLTVFTSRCILIS